MYSYSKPIIDPNKKTFTKIGEVPTDAPAVTTVAASTNAEETTVESTPVEQNEETFVTGTLIEDIPEEKKSDEEILEDIVKEAADYAEENEDISKIRELQEKEYSDRDAEELKPSDAIEDENLPEGVSAAVREFPVDAAGKPNFIKESGDSAPASSVDILHIDEKDELDKERIAANLSEIAKKHELSDDAAAMVLDLMLAYKKDKTINVYPKMPDEMKKQIKEICLQSGIPLSSSNMVAKMMLDELINETSADDTFIDFEKSINEAMKIPSLVDMYEEEVGENMSEKLPKMADAIEKENPEKAKMLRQIAANFDAAITFSKAREAFDTITRIRKLMRRDSDKVRRFAEELNFANQNTKFRMPDATTLIPILYKVIANDEDNDITTKEVDKFLVLIFRSCDNLNKDDTVDASYIYYLLKNISMLAYVKDDAASNTDSFSAELISNIKSLIYYIRAKEAEFYANNNQQSRK